MENDISYLFSESQSLENVPEEEIIDLAGYQVTKAELFAHTKEPAITVWEDRIKFNMACLRRFPGVTHIQLLVNPEAKRILVKPAPSKDSDAINWIKNLSAPRTSKLECSMFTKQLFETWGWDEAMRYRTNGKLVKFDRKLMLLFDFNRPEIWKGMKMVRDNG